MENKLTLSIIDRISDSCDIILIKPLTLYFKISLLQERNISIRVFFSVFTAPGPSQTVAAVGALFGRGRKTTKDKKVHKSQITWTIYCMCLSDKDTSKCPSVDEKETLYKAGLGLKKLM